jgi:hypothetical protein
MRLRSKWTAEGLLWWLVVAMAGAFAATLVAYSLDGRTIDGVQSVWAKPIKFELSLALHAATLALAISLLSPEARADRLVMLAAIACCVATTFEMTYIAVQAARQQASHFNLDTPTTRLLYGMMAFGAVTLVGAAAVVGVITLFDGRSGVAPALRLGVAAGFIGGAVLTLVTAFTIGARLSPYVGPPPGFERLPLTGWSLVGGDLRIAHFLATHMMQAVPLAAIILSRGVPQGFAVSGTFLFAAVWTGWTIFEFRTALGGEVSALLTTLLRTAALH